MFRVGGVRRRRSSVRATRPARALALPVAAVLVGAAALAGCSTAADSGGSGSSATAPTPGRATSANATTGEPQPGGSGIPVRPTQDGSAVVVNVSVGGGAAVPLQLDTGSAGLRIFKQDVGPQTKDDPDTGPNTASFIDGTTYKYEAAKAPVVIGGVPLATPVPVDVVTDVSCEAGVPDCVPGAAEAIKGGAHGILGVALTTDDVDSTPSPLLYVPDYRSFTVALDESGAGVVRPGVPTTAAVGSWQLTKGESGVPGVQGWEQDFQACWRLKSAAPSCVTTAFDSGSTDVYLQPTLPGAKGLKGYLDETQGPLELLFPEATSPPIWSLTPSDDGNRHVSVAEPGEDATDVVLAGLPLFDSFDVAFDQQTGTVSLHGKG